MPAVATRADALRVKVAGVEVQHLTAVGAIPGVVVLAAAALNGLGTGRLRSTGDGSLLSWRAPGSANFGTDVDASGDGSYLLEDGDDFHKFLRVQVYASFLRAEPVEAPVFLGDRFANQVGAADLTAAEASAGDVLTYTLELHNDSSLKLFDLKAWLDSVAAGSGNLEISKDGVAWFAPDSEEHADVLLWAELAATTSTTLHLRRTIAPASASAASVLSLVHFAWDNIT